MADKTYNGWTNYETWAVKLWMDNEQSSYRYWKSTTQEMWDEAEATSYSTREQSASRDLADKLKEEFEENNPLASEASVWSDLLGAALCEVNWREIAENLLEEVDKTADEEDEDEDE